MGLYATVTSLQTLMVGTNFTVTSALAVKIVNRAEARVNSVLARRYDLSQAAFQTTTSIPLQVREWSEMIAEGHMWKALARGGAGKESMARGDALIKEALADLKMLAEYELELVATSGSVIADMSNTAFRVMCNTSTYINTFNEDDELAWAVDPDKLEDIADERG